MSRLVEDTESLQDSIHNYLKAINISIVIAVSLIFAGFVGGVTGFLLLKQDKISFNYLSIITTINFCLSIYNSFAWQRLKQQRYITKLRLSYLEMRDNDGIGFKANRHF